MKKEDEWKEQLAKGEISQDDFDSLMKSEESLKEMDEEMKDEK